MPVFVVLFGDERVERIPRHLAGLHVVHQPRQIVGERQRRRGAAHHQWRCGRVVRLDRARPGRRSAGQRQAAFQAVEGRRQFERVRRSVRTPPAQRSVRLRRCRPVPPAAAGSQPRCSAPRETRRARAAWRGASAGRLSREPVLRLLPASNPSTSLPSTSAAMTVRRKGAEAGTLKTCMRGPIRRPAYHGMAIGPIWAGSACLQAVRRRFRAPPVPLRRSRRGFRRASKCPRGAIRTAGRPPRRRRTALAGRIRRAARLRTAAAR